MEIESAFKRLLIKNPFYGLFCLSLPKVVTTAVDTLSVTRNGVSCQLNINPDFWKQHTDDEQLALLQHELSHIALQHMFMSDSFADPKFFNMAADAEVNSYIDHLPQSAFTAAYLSRIMGTTIENGLGTKKYYEILKNYQQQQQAQAQNPQSPCNGGQGGQGSSGNQSGSNSDSDENTSPSSSPSQATPNDEEEDNSSENTEGQQVSSEKKGEQSDSSQENSQQENKNEQYPDEFSQFDPIDDHSSWKDFKNLPEANKQLIKNNIEAVLKQTAEEVEKMRGTIPGELSGIIEKLREKKPEVFNWKAYFRRMLGSIYDVNIRSTRRKPSKRFEGAAGIQHKKKVSILVAIDTSGSVCEKELQDFFSEIDYIYKAGARITILECDTDIHNIVEYDGKNLPKIYGRGGTDFNQPVEYYFKHSKEYASLIYFTDGEAPMPRRKVSNLVWIISSYGRHQDYPGKAVYIPKSN